MTNRERADRIVSATVKAWGARLSGEDVPPTFLDAITEALDEAEKRGRAVTEADPVSLQLAAADDRIDNLEAEIERLRVALKTADEALHEIAQWFGTGKYPCVLVGVPIGADVTPDPDAPYLERAVIAEFERIANDALEKIGVLK